MADTMTQIQPNDKCPCGSGKKYKKCHGNMQPRKHSVFVDIGPIENTKAKSLNGISFDAESGKVLLHTPLGETVEATHISMSTYERKNKSKSDKILCLSEGISFNNVPGDLHFSLHDYLSRFDIVFAIDTNTEVIKGENVSVGVYFRLYAKRTKVGENLFRYDIPESAFTYRRKTPCGIEEGIDVISVGEIPIPISSSRAMCFRGLSASDAEKYAIHELVNTIISEKRNAPDIKVGIITDHMHALRIDTTRDEPLYGDFVLPKNVIIIYASDVANETVLNFAVRKCHKEARDLLKGLKEKGFIDLGKTRIQFEQIPYPNPVNNRLESDLGDVTRPLAPQAEHSPERMRSGEPGGG